MNICTLRVKLPRVIFRYQLVRLKVRFSGKVTFNNAVSTASEKIQIILFV